MKSQIIKCENGKTKSGGTRETIGVFITMISGIRKSDKTIIWSRDQNPSPNEDPSKIDKRHKLPIFQYKGLLIVASEAKNLD